MRDFPAFLGSGGGNSEANTANIGGNGRRQPQSSGVSCRSCCHRLAGRGPSDERGWGRPGRGYAAYEGMSRPERDQAVPQLWTTTVWPWECVSLPAVPGVRSGMGGDQRQKLFRNLETLPGDILLSAVTAPGAGLLPWDTQQCAAAAPLCFLAVFMSACSVASCLRRQRQTMPTFDRCRLPQRAISTTATSTTK
jgi:hypothetical protein